MSELEGEIAAPQLALVMCLSLWAYYIQIKGGFTDRRQAPAPASNQTLPSGEPCGARAYVAAASQRDAAPCPPVVLHRDHGGCRGGGSGSGVGRGGGSGVDRGGTSELTAQPGSARLGPGPPTSLRMKLKLKCHRLSHPEDVKFVLSM